MCSPLTPLSLTGNSPSLADYTRTGRISEQDQYLTQQVYINSCLTQQPSHVPSRFSIGHSPVFLSALPDPNQPFVDDSEGDLFRLTPDAPPVERFFMYLDSSNRRDVRLKRGIWKQCQWDAAFVFVNVLRILLKVVKGYPPRIQWLMYYKGHAVIPRVFTISIPSLQFVGYRIMKEMVKYLGEKWQLQNLPIISAIHLAVPFSLGDSWREWMGVDSEEEKSRQATGGSEIRDYFATFTRENYPIYFSEPKEKEINDESKP